MTDPGPHDTDAREADPGDLGDIGTNGPGTPTAVASDAAGGTLGLEAGQLDRFFDYGARRGNPLVTLDHLGMLSKSIPPESARKLSGPPSPLKNSRVMSIVR